MRKLRIVKGVRKNTRNHCFDYGNKHIDFRDQIFYGFGVLLYIPEYSDTVGKAVFG